MFHQLIAARRFHLAPLAALTLGLLILGGCGDTPTGKMYDIKTVSEFNRVIATSGRPVMIDFYKDNCPTCVVQEGVLEKVSDEYGDRVYFAKFKIREATMQATNPEFMKRYNLMWVPTTILFVNGKERTRWVFNHTEGEFRTELDKVVPRRQAMNHEPPPAFSSTGAPGVPDENGCIPGQGCPVIRDDLRKR